jgi:long-chain fatty acid transport protein
MSWGAGFALFEHGNRAMGMGGAFTAVADDPSAIFWNPAGLAFQADKGTQIMGGVTFIKAAQDFYGDNPFPGEGHFSSQEDQVFFPPHAYIVVPVSDKIVLAGGMMTPFGLGTWWDEDFAGRYISKRVDLKTYDFTFTSAFRIGEFFAVGLGVDYYVGQIDLTRNIGFINPFTQQLTDVGQVHMYTDGMGNGDFAWNASFLLDMGYGIKLGALYRSDFTIEFEGEASFTQYFTGYQDFDNIIAGTIPFDQNIPLETKIDYPDYWAVGLSWSNEQWTLSGTYGAMGWASFQELALEFPGNSMFNTTVHELYDDTNQFRIGAEYRASASWAFQLGYLEDETPQPTVSMSPLLGDGDRTGYSVGISWIHKKMRTDLGYMYLPIDERCTNGGSLDGYEGCYDTDPAHLLGATLSLRF